ncbi:MAG TPA: N-6 DNA methylase [Herpetosiphonaceae bacterium]
MAPAHARDDARSDMTTITAPRRPDHMADLGSSTLLVRSAGWIPSAEPRSAAQHPGRSRVPRQVIAQRDTLADADETQHDFIVSNPPFGGACYLPDVRPDLKAWGTKTEILFTAAILKQVRRGGRIAVILPDGMLFGSTKVLVKLRKTLVEDHMLQTIISLPSDVFYPFAGVSTSILMVQAEGRTTQIRFYAYPVAPQRAHRSRRSPEPVSIDLETMETWETPVEALGSAYELDARRYQPQRTPEIQYDDPRVIIQRLLENQRTIMQTLDELQMLLNQDW